MSFEKAFAHVIGVEGGYVDNPNDKGGATKFGITQKVLEAWRKKPVTKDDVKNLQLEEAKKIYKKNYWDTMSLDSVRSQTLQHMLFDQGVNSGVGTAAKALQQILGVTQDGKIGPKTIDAINAKHPFELCSRFIQVRQLFYVRLCKQDPSQMVFLEGWINRTHKLIDLLDEAVKETV